MFAELDASVEAEPDTLSFWWNRLIIGSGVETRATVLLLVVALAGFDSALPLIWLDAAAPVCTDVPGAVS